MHYALLIHNAPAEYERPNDEERQAISREYYALREDPRVVDGAALHPPQAATTVRVQEGQTVLTDGPFANTKEVFGGWYIVDAADLDDAVEIVTRIPAVRFGGAVEVRPLVEGPH
jgi:hypothetical protein